jgi:hypothetical protein
MNLMSNTDYGRNRWPAMLSFCRRAFLLNQLAKAYDAKRGAK